jgi:hypothetical protein
MFIVSLTMQDNFMEYPEMYHLHWWKGEPAAVVQFTPEKDISGAFYVDKSKPYKVWARDKNVQVFFEKSIKQGAHQFSRHQFTHDKHEFFDWIFGSEPRR